MISIIISYILHPKKHPSLRMLFSSILKSSSSCISSGSSSVTRFLFFTLWNSTVYFFTTNFLRRYCVFRDSCNLATLPDKTIQRLKICFFGRRISLQASTNFKSRNSLARSTNWYVYSNNSNKYFFWCKILKIHALRKEIANSFDIFNLIMTES